MSAPWNNTRLVSQSRWRVMAVHLFAKALGVLCHVEGYPFGSARRYVRPKEQEWSFATFGPYTFVSNTGGDDAAR